METNHTTDLGIGQQHPIIEYKVIDTRAVGTPLGSGVVFSEQLESGLNKLGADGWQLVETIGSNLIIFSRHVIRRPPRPIAGVRGIIAAENAALEAMKAN